MNARDYLPDSVCDAALFLRAQLAPFPGRGNVMLRCVLTSAIVIVISMTLQVPSLALSLLVVFYVTQANVVMTRLVGMLFIVGSTLAIGSSIVLLKFTFDYPLLRIVIASVLFFASVYLMRVLKLGTVFFIVAIVIIYVQTFVDRTDQAEVLVRAVLWVWVAVNYPIALTLLINTLLLPLEPQQQLRAEIHRQLAAVDDALTGVIEGRPASAPVSHQAVQQGALALQKLLKFAAMRDARYRAEPARRLACIATVSRLFRAAGALPAALPQPTPVQQDILRTLRAHCRALDDAIAADRPYRMTPSLDPVQYQALMAEPVLVELGRALKAYGDLDARQDGQAGKAGSESLVAPDAFTNPAYARFSLKTLLAVLLCYVFYTSVDWQGIHTIMLTCVIVALPSLGASTQRALLRVGGALAGSGLALFMVVFVIPHLESIVGLLAMTLPVVALGGWIAAGSERIGYAGTQLLFTFSLALLDQFGPTSDLTEIRDRMVGILLGVAIATFVQMAFWREGESEALRQKLVAALRAVSALLRPPPAGGAPEPLPYAQQQLQAWATLAECEATLARVMLEPGWQEGEQTQWALRAQTVLDQGREIMLAGNALHNAQQSDAARAILADAAAGLGRYADQLAHNPPLARTPRDLGMTAPVETGADASLLAGMRDLITHLSGLPDWHTPQPLYESADHD
ncbi:MAG: FUSC family protein [Paludibacterium sp.]|uniref:FUSC family protein n=1 Tax=Paludibacterium sp. TaxID=1917523 RepID=UPI0025FA7FF9|nr:FUSC family protein [Paludibacterium sp.]MBV8047404.1 FUSC family protein [Paludibacterium sp.]MBV8646880.1 FUSC family protein [Paludibacterium sp.]